MHGIILVQKAKKKGHVGKIAYSVAKVRQKGITEVYISKKQKKEKYVFRVSISRFGNFVPKSLA